MSTEMTLLNIQALTPVAVFQTQNGVEDVVSKLERDIRAMSFDPTSEKGRKHIKSVAYQVARSKTALDDMGKLVKEDAMELVRRVDADRRVITSRLDALRDEVRKPVDDYEAREQARVDGIRDQIGKIELLGQRLEGLSIQTLKGGLEELDALREFDFQEFKARADLAVQQTRNALKAAIIIAEKAEEDRLEAERLAAAQAEEERLAAVEAQKKREAEIARAAAEKAKADAEEAARREAEMAAAELEKQKADAARAEREAAERIEKMRRDAEEAALRAEADKKEAEERAKHEQVAAIERERKRAADEKAAQEAADLRRAQDKAHRTRINREILSALLSVGASEELGKSIISAILKGSVPHVSIGY